MTTPPTADGEQADDSGVTSVRRVALPGQLVDRVEDRLSRTNYDSPDEYVAFVLRETLAHVETRTDDDPVDIDESEVQSRLESLGYLE